MTSGDWVASPEEHQAARVAYVHSDALQRAADQLPANVGRSTLVHSLISAYGLLDTVKDGKLASGSKVLATAVVIKPKPAVKADLLRYHDAAYVEYLLEPRLRDEDLSCSSEASSSSSSSSTHARRSKKKRRKTEQYGLEHDCPPFPALAEYAFLVAGATLTAVRALMKDEADIAINWDGGRHHAMRKKASGFCYVADVVIGIMALAKEGVPRNLSMSPSEAPKRKPRILYLDLDIHYGDGVAQAFHSPHRYPPLRSTNRPPRIPQVMTISLHHSSPAFFPPQLPLTLLPSPDTPHPFSLSIPLERNPSCATYARLMKHSVEPVVRAFDPDFVVLQLGLDGLAKDPLAKAGLWMLGGEGGVGWCVERVKSWNKPLCVLGGGGYDAPNAARGWTYATSVLLGHSLPLDGEIPEHEHVEEYAPWYALEIDKGFSPDMNTDEHLCKVEEVYRIIAERVGDLIR